MTKLDQDKPWRRNLLFLIVAITIVGNLVFQISNPFVDELVAGQIAALPVLVIWWVYGDRVLPLKYSSRSNVHAQRFAIVAVLAMNWVAALILLMLS
ncbi:MAG: hypothetical protein NXH88_12765 [Hyphomonas sp.]|nr:hypothetical protein [Hyphomonas sp.]